MRMPTPAIVLLLASPAHAEAPAAKDTDVEARFGEGITIKGDDLSVQLRARAQVRATLTRPGEDAAALEPSAAIRRMRLNLNVKNPSRDLQFIVQLGLAPQDMEPDLLIPVRDATLIWTPLRDLGVKFGQHKVPFNRERVVSSGSLQFVDRSITNAELNLDRDVGIQLFSDDLFGLGERLGYQVGVYNGDGRNRFVGNDGLLYVAHVDVRPLGAFADLRSQGDLDREAGPRLALGAGVARNADTVRARSTTSDTLPLAFTYEHAAADVVFKGHGLSLHGEVLYREADKGTHVQDVDGVTVTTTSRSAWGWSAMGGYVLGGRWEPVARYAVVTPIDGMDSAALPETEARVGLNWYVQGHDLKVQADAARLGGDAHPDGDLDVRLQTQVYF